MSCVICGQFMDYGDTVRVGSKGLKTLCKLSELRRDNLFYCSENVQEVILHTNCRKKYTKENVKGYYKPLQPSNKDNIVFETSASTSSSDFLFKDKCFFRTEDLSDDVMEKENIKTSKTSQLTFKISNQSTKGTIIRALQETSSSNNEVILRRISDVDLVAAQARYHRPCYLGIVNCRKTLKRGRPESIDVSSAMQIIYDYIENNDESQFSLNELRNLSDYVPCYNTLIKKLSEKYGQRLFITEVPGRSPILTLKDSLGKILRDTWYSQKNNDEHSERIVKKAAEIIREDICSKAYEKDNYPSPNNFLKNAEQDVPVCLNIFLKSLASQKLDKEEKCIENCFPLHMQ